MSSLASNRKVRMTQSNPTMMGLQVLSSEVSSFEASSQRPNGILLSGELWRDAFGSRGTSGEWILLRHAAMPMTDDG